MASLNSNRKLDEIHSSRCDGEELQFIPNCNHQESLGSGESGFCSPPLWQSPSEPLLSHHNSRLQAIARGRFELMELVKNMPESSYELSLTDLVEIPRPQTQTPRQDISRYSRNRGKESKRNDDRITTSASFENKGLLLKMVFPIGMNSKRRTSLEKNASGSCELWKTSGEREWWKKRFTDSDSSRTSGGGSTSIRKRNGYLGVCCWPFFESSRGESAE